MIFANCCDGTNAASRLAIPLSTVKRCTGDAVFWMRRDSLAGYIQATVDSDERQIPSLSAFATVLNRSSSIEEWLTKNVDLDRTFALDRFRQPRHSKDALVARSTVPKPKADIHGTERQVAETVREF
jgi:hypothetical protein